LRYAGVHAKAAEQSERNLYQVAAACLGDLVNRADGLFTAEEQRRLQDAVMRIGFALRYWSQSPEPGGPVASQAQRECSNSLYQATYVLNGSSGIERLWIGGASAAPPRTITRRWPSGSGVLLLRVGLNGAPSAAVPQFVREKCDLARCGEVALNLGATETTYVALFFTNAPEGTKHVAIRLRSGAAEVATADLAVTTPPTVALRVSMLDGATGKATPAAAAVYALDNELMVPDEALSFEKGGFVYGTGRVRNYGAPSWPGNAQQRRAFFVNGGFSLRLPQGNYRILATKGFEYVPVAETVTVKPGGATSHVITLRRWTDMPARGWYSGDGHVHYARADDEANRRLMLWTQAEDVHVSNVLRMGDAKQTYFEQYGFGKEGRFVSGDYALVPGQEDPRTNVLGHTMQLNIQRPVHLPERYYRYDLVFDDVHRQGGITGYAHLVQPNGMTFFVRRDMAMDIPAGRIDFAEICEFGAIGQDYYYEFLNLGFPLTASAGSDVPWGNTIGTSRVYVYTGERFSADAWYAGLKAGHTFVTTGAMLEFSVNGRIPGDEIEAKPGDVLRIKASAFGKPVPPQYLEIVSQGDVVKSAKADQGQASLEFTLPVSGSTWLAARCAGAQTTPVYIKVGGQRFWKRGQVARLIAQRLKDLQEVDDLLGQQIPGGGNGSYDNPQVWKESAADLREQVKSSRETYARLLEESKR
jgi:hypothetical protein